MDGFSYASYVPLNSKLVIFISERETNTETIIQILRTHVSIQFYLSRGFLIEFILVYEKLLFMHPLTFLSDTCDNSYVYEDEKNHAMIPR